MAKSRLNSKVVSQILNQKKKNRKFRSFIIVLAAFVMALTSFSLSETGITLQAELICEKEEHIHDGNCYNSELVLVCEEEHEHTEECYSEEVVQICEKEEHVHLDTCYEAEKVEEVAPVEEVEPETTEVEETTEPKEAADDEEEIILLEEIVEEVEMETVSHQAMKAATKVGDYYEVTSWKDLEDLIKDDNKYTDNVLNVKVDGIIASNSQIVIPSNKTVNLSGKDSNSAIYVDKDSTNKKGMFSVNGTFKVTDLVVSGQKAEKKADSSTSTSCKKDTTSSVATVSGGKIYYDSTKFGTLNKTLKVGNDVDDANQFVTVDAGTENSTSYFYIKNKTYYLGIQGTGDGVSAYLTDANSVSTDKYKWTLRSDGVIVNKTGNGNIIIYRDPTSGAVSVTTETTSGCTPATPDPNAGKWVPIATDNIDSLVETGTKGFFITANLGSSVELGNGAVIRDMKYTGNEKDVSPIYVKGGSLTVNGATIENNIGGAMPKNRAAAGSNALTYKDVINAASSKSNNKDWDLNWGGMSFRENQDDPNNHAAGAILIEENGNVVFNNGTIGGTGKGNIGIAGAVYIHGGTFTQKGGTIKENDSYKGAVVVDGAGSTYNFEKGSIDGNGSAYLGGGITAINEGNVVIGIDNNSCGGVIPEKPQIINNKTVHQGGGIYVHSNNVHLNNANIENNIAHLMGGGIYIYGGDSNANDKNSVLVLNNTYVTDNTAGNQAAVFKSTKVSSTGFYDQWSSNGNYGEGGGIWLCTYGSVVMDGEEVHLYGNHINPAMQGVDFYKHSKGTEHGVIVEFDTLAAKGNATAYDDYKTKDGTAFSYPRENDGSVNSNFSPISGRLGLENHSTYNFTSEAEGLCNAVMIKGNTAGYAGGGIGSNGILSYKKLTEEEFYRPEFSFTKDWKNEDGSAISTVGKSAQFIVNVYDLTSEPEVLVKTYGTQDGIPQEVLNGNPNAGKIILKDDANIVDDPDGANNYGFSVNKWKATIKLPQIFKEDGTSIYAGLTNSTDNSKDETNKSYSIDDLIRIEIIEVGDTANSYDLKLGDLSFTTTSTVITNKQNDVKVTFNDVAIKTSLTNEYKKKTSSLEIVKVKEDGETEITGDTTFEVWSFNGEHHKEIKLPTDGSSFKIEDVEKWFKEFIPSDWELTRSNFYLVETNAPNDSYAVLASAIPFTFEKDEYGNYKAKMHTKVSAESVPGGKVTAVPDTHYSKITNGKKDAFILWNEDGETIEKVSFDGSTGAEIRFIITNEQKRYPVYIKKMDDTGSILLSNASFTLRPANKNGNGAKIKQFVSMYSEDKPEYQGLYTYANEDNDDTTGGNPNAPYVQIGKVYSIWEKETPSYNGVKYNRLNNGSGVDIPFVLDEDGNPHLITKDGEVINGETKYSYNDLPDGWILHPNGTNWKTAWEKIIENNQISIESVNIDGIQSVVISIMNVTPDTNPKPAKLDISAEKTLENVDDEYLGSTYNGEFSFTITGERLEGTGSVPLPNPSTISNVGSKVDFNTIEFTRPGKYKYTIKENVGEDSEITYDPSEKVLIVEVKEVNVGNDKKLVVIVDETNSSGVTIEESESTYGGNDDLKPNEKITSSSYYQSLNTDDGTIAYTNYLHTLTAHNHVAYCLDHTTDTFAGIAPTNHDYVEFDINDDFSGYTNFGNVGPHEDLIKKLFYYGYPFDSDSGAIINKIVDELSVANTTQTSLKKCSTSSSYCAFGQATPGGTVPSNEYVYSSYYTYNYYNYYNLSNAYDVTYDSRQRKYVYTSVTSTVPHVQYTQESAAQLFRAASQGVMHEIMDGVTSYNGSRYKPANNDLRKVIKWIWEKIDSGLSPEVLDSINLHAYKIKNFSNSSEYQRVITAIIPRNAVHATFETAFKNTVKVEEITIHKKDAKTKELLAGAGFELREKGTNKPIDLTPGADGVFKATIRRDIVYELIEVNPPEFYYGLGRDHPIEFKLDSETNKLILISTDNLVTKLVHVNEDNGFLLEVENEAITYTLPETGGLGTSTCIGMGSIMIIIGALLLGKKYLSEVRG